MAKLTRWKRIKERKEKYGDKEKTKNKMAYAGHNFSSKE